MIELIDFQLEIGRSVGEHGKQLNQLKIIILVVGIRNRRNPLKTLNEIKLSVHTEYVVCHSNALGHFIVDRMNVERVKGAFIRLFNVVFEISHLFEHRLTRAFPKIVSNKSNNSVISSAIHLPRSFVCFT